MYYSYNPDTGEVLYHAGVKGMKWGVKRARNAAALGNAAGRSAMNNFRQSSTSMAGSVARTATKLTGDGTSHLRNTLANQVNNRFGKNADKKANVANISNFKGHVALQKAVNRNAKFSRKLDSKISSATGKKKEKLQNKKKAWDAYSSTFANKVAKQRNNLNSSYSNIAKDQKERQQENNRRINTVNKSIYGKYSHGDTQQAIQSVSNTTVNNAKKAYKGAKKALKVAATV